MRKAEYQWNHSTVTLTNRKYRHINYESYAMHRSLHETKRRWRLSEDDYLDCTQWESKRMQDRRKTVFACLLNKFYRWMIEHSFSMSNVLSFWALLPTCIYVFRRKRLFSNPFALLHYISEMQYFWNTRISNFKFVGSNACGGKCGAANRHYFPKIHTVSMHSTTSSVFCRCAHAEIPFEFRIWEI